MPRISVDFSDKREDLEPGLYDAILNNVKLRDSKNGGQFLNWEFTIFDEKAPGRKVWSITGVNEKTLWVTVKQLKALGYVPAEGGQLELNFDDETGLMVEPELAEIPCQIKISHRTWEGRTQVQVDIQRRLDSGMSVKF